MNEDLSQGILEPPVPPPKLLKQTKKKRIITDPVTGEKKEVPLCHRKLVKGKIRTSGFPYVSPSRTKSKQGKFRVRYSRRGVIFDRTFQSQLLCAWIANEIRMAEDSELMERLGTQLVDPINFMTHATNPVNGGFLWILETKAPTVIKIDHEKFDRVGHKPWFQVRGKPGICRPAVTVDENRKVHLSWVRLWTELWAMPPSEYIFKQPCPEMNPAGQHVMDWSSSNVMRKDQVEFQPHWF